MAKTFDLDDPDQKAGYLEETLVQIVLYGGLYQTFDYQRNTVTVLDAPDVEIRVREDSA